jgi:ribosomal protein S16
LEVLGSYDPIKHIFEADIDSIKSWIEKWAKPSERVAKLLFKTTNDAMFKKFYKEIERKALPKKEKAE